MRNRVTPPLVSVVVPVFNKVEFLRQSLDSIVTAASRFGRAELIFVDNGSTDGSYEQLLEYGAIASVKRFNGRTISAIRNYGARQARGRFLSFIDCDCVIPADYFRALVEVFEETGAAAVGCEYGIPTPAHWTERAWHDLVSVEEDRYRRYLNGGNLAVRSERFTEVGGFDERLPTGEDTDICARLRQAGYRIFESQRLKVIHLGNPKSLREFFRKQLWHGVGVLHGGRSLLFNRATLMVIAHAAAVLAAVSILAWPVRLAVAPRLLGAVGLALLVPAATVAYRVVATRRVGNPLLGVVVCAAFYFARATALVWRPRASRHREPDGVRPRLSGLDGKQKTLQ